MADGIPPDILQHHVYEVRFGWEGITDDDIHEKQKDVWHYNSVPVPETTGGAKPVVGRALETITAVHPEILDPINIDSEDMQVRINLSLPKNPDGSTRAGIVLADIQYRMRKKLTADEVARDIMNLLVAGKAGVRAAREILKEQRRRRQQRAGGKTPAKASGKAPNAVPVPSPAPSLAPAPFRVPEAVGELDPPPHSEEPLSGGEEESTGLSPGTRKKLQSAAGAGVGFSIAGAVRAAAILIGEYGWVATF